MMDPHANELFEKIQERISVNHTRQRRRRTWGMAAIAGSAAIALTGGALAVVQASATAKTVSLCVESVDAGASVTEIGAPSTDGSVHPISDMKVRVALAEEQCAAAWRIGIFNDDGPSESAMNTVPALFTCLRTDGRLAVYPVSDHASCESLGSRIP